MAQIDVFAGIGVEFTHEALLYFPTQTPDSEFDIRTAYFTGLVGSQQTAFEALFTGPFTTAPDTDQTRGHLGGVRSRQIAGEAVAAYNQLGTGMVFDDPPPEPHCIEIYYEDGEIIIVYNWLLTIASTSNAPPPPGGMYHVVVSTRDAGSL